MTRIKRIEDHTNAELEAAIALAERSFRPFWIVLHGIDAFMERRERRRAAAENSAHQITMDQIGHENSWGRDC